MADIETSTSKDEVVLEHREAGMSLHHHHAPAADVALHHDQVAPEAIGGLYEEMPKGYYWSKDFLGTLIVSEQRSVLHAIVKCPLTSLGNLPCPNQRISRLGPTSQHTLPHQCVAWRLSKHNLGCTCMDPRLHSRFSPCWSSIR
jgi:hypothetical protein